MKKIIILLLGFMITNSLFSQLQVLKLVGKNSKDHKIGYGAFYSMDFPIGGAVNRRIVLEADFGVFGAKPVDYDLETAVYGSIKLGYRHIFSEESNTGFFVEPQAGYCLTGIGMFDGELGKGLALAAVAGYSLGVGQRNNAFLFGLKWESDLAGDGKQLHSIGFRVAFIY